MVDTPLLESFKTYMRIFHSAEDDYLMDLLSASELDILALVGGSLSDREVKELVFNRARYAYTGNLEFFYENFQSRIFDLSLRLNGEELTNDESTI
ncbi:MULTISPECIES: head-tail connector protein [unclassified Aerococcus]|uniref:head-tail connector protein n=1 Tax=unclassified Aerococcus TaxID=2618060 RepID=UPI0025BF196E|nr:MULTISPECIES: head-tail connector protein [unclassified Aerococcus]